MEEVERTQKTYGKIASKYQKEHSDIEEIGKYADSFISMVNGNVLDIGCGPGRDAHYFEENGLFVVGIYITPEFLAMAQENSTSSDFISMDARYLSFTEGSFDGIWACASLLHLPKADFPNAIGEAYKAIKNDGTLFLSLKKGSGEGYVGEENKRYFSYYLEDEITGILENNGFHVISLETEEKKDTWISIFAKKAKKHC